MSQIVTADAIAGIGHPQGTRTYQMLVVDGWYLRERSSVLLTNRTSRI